MAIMGIKKLKTLLLINENTNLESISEQEWTNIFIKSKKYSIKPESIELNKKFKVR